VRQLIFRNQMPPKKTRTTPMMSKYSPELPYADAGMEARSSDTNVCRSAVQRRGEGGVKSFCVCGAKLESRTARDVGGILMSPSRHSCRRFARRNHSQQEFSSNLTGCRGKISSLMTFLVLFTRVSRNRRSLGTDYGRCGTLTYYPRVL
jgi:hypothetical protein